MAAYATTILICTSSKSEWWFLAWKRLRQKLTVWKDTRSTLYALLIKLLREKSIERLHINDNRQDGARWKGQGPTIELCSERILRFGKAKFITNFLVSVFSWKADTLLIQLVKHLTSFMGQGISTHCLQSLPWNLWIPSTPLTSDVWLTVQRNSVWIRKTS